MTLPMIVIPLLCASAVWYHIARLTPALSARGARPEAHIIAGAVTLGAIVALALIPVIGSGLWQLAGILLWVVNNLAPDLLVRLTGGPQPPAPERAEVASILDEARACLDAGNADGWRAAVERLQSVPDPAARGVATAIAEYARELERGMPATRATERRYQDEVQRFLYDTRPPNQATAVVAALLAAVIGAVPGLSGAIIPPAVVGGAPGAAIGPVCDDALIAAGTAFAAGQSTSDDPSTLLLDDPGADFTLVGEGWMSLEQSAASRVDTETLPQLREAGFTAAFGREWIRDDGTMLGNDVFWFETPEGARSFHQTVTAYACRYSSESFDVPGGGVGLRIHYGSGDPFRDQVAWIDGNRRIVIAIGYRKNSGGHDEVLDLASQAREASRR